MDEEEIWRPIEGYKWYEVSNMGRIRSIDHYVPCRGFKQRITRGRVLKTRKYSDGYLRVKLCHDGCMTMKTVHRLVAQAFIENSDPEKYDQINHKDENPSNNRWDNLEWCDAKYNINYGERTKKARPKISAAKRKSPVMQISPTTGEVLAIYPSTTEVERRTRFAQSQICCACRGGHYVKGKWINFKKAYGYIWRYMWESEEEKERAAQ